MSCVPLASELEDVFRVQTLVGREEEDIGQPFQDVECLPLFSGSEPPDSTSYSRIVNNAHGQCVHRALSVCVRLVKSRSTLQPACTRCRHPFTVADKNIQAVCSSSIGVDLWTTLSPAVFSILSLRVVTKKSTHCVLADSGSENRKPS